MLVMISMSVVGQTKWFTTYYATWSMIPLGSSNYALPPWEMDFRGLTHVVLFDNGNVTQTAPYWAYMFNSIPADAETDSLGVEYNANAAPGDGVNRVHYLDSLVTIAHRNGVKVVITIPAVAKTTPNLNYVTADSGRTQVFVNTLVAWAERKNLDGVELDWEGWAGTSLPATAQVDRFVRMLYRRVHTMKTYTGAPGIIMISAGSSYQSYYSASQDYMVDQYNLQLYDYAYAWQGEPVNSAVAWYISPLHQGNRPANFEGDSYETRGPLQWVAAGHDPKRIGLGIPTYGYILRNVNALFQPMTDNGDYGSAHYQVIEDLKNNGGVETWDDVRKVRSISGTAIRNGNAVYYGSDGINAGQKFLAVGETPQSMTEKVNWMKANNFGGIMTYDFVSDLDPTKPIASNLRNPLQRAVANALGGTVTIDPPPPSTQTLTAQKGWSMISSFVAPNSRSLDVLFAPLRANNIVLKNGAGDVYWPSLEINSIGNWNPFTAYWLYSSAPASLSMDGTLLDPAQSPLTLLPGISLVPYLRSSPMAPALALAGVNDASLIVYDEAGNYYWPSQGIFTLTLLQPGHAYSMFVKTKITFRYPANTVLNKTAASPR
jgi:GH18 family chitinase